MNPNQELVFGMTVGDVLAGVTTLLLLIAGDLLLRHHLRRRAAAADSGDAAEREGPSPTSRLAWAGPALRAAIAPASLLLWACGLHFVLHALVPPELFDGLGANLLTAASWLRGVLTLVSLLWLLARVGAILEKALAAPTPGESPGWNDVLLPLLVRALRITLPVLAAMLALPMLSLSPGPQALAQNLLSVGLIGALAYLLLKLLDAGTTLLLSRYRLDIADNLQARSVHTQVTVLRKVAVVVIGLFALASMLMVFESVRRLGATLLASAGIASVIIGFAAQRSIATLLAGFQIAMTQPIRVDDVVIVEGEWGRIEEITLTYVVVAIWDQRRLVLPITYFIEKPFQNWTRTSAELLGTVFLYVDYSVPLAPLRAEFERLLEATPLWDKRVKVLQVTDTKQSTLELRALASAANASIAWDLRCYLREHLVTWLQANHPGALPRVRAEVEHTGPLQLARAG